MFLAYEGDAVLGSTYGLLNLAQSQAGRVGGMWVEPAWRRRGVGRALLQQVFNWARERRLNRLGLWAPSHSPAAVLLYRGAGFRETGKRRPLPTNLTLEVLEMEAPVDSGHETVGQSVPR
jgi:GNAT superfamily N-acetyltransferase